ncbi:hypothetical protein [Colwellia sp. 12G3]|uniref:hypothetical protein n=1 Tax=Colwellia sp. 12G3 TaxID=2058299 RepID=UPI000C343187|nr:hypothetical protein [Colwellia sp. 12G3]PKI17263.1 hypothetical protein CXF71_04635 [Colwellia sp. 12G3]
MNKLSIISTALAVSFSVSVSASDWAFQFEPYLMATQIQGNASIGRVVGAPVDVDFSTILDNLDMAAMLHFEAHHKAGWGVVMDYGFMDLSNKVTNNRDGMVHIALRQGVLESLGLYRMQYGGYTVDYFAGVRWWDNDISLTMDANITPDRSTNVSVKEDWLDVVVGMRVTGKINNSWNYIARADLGGFGLSADFTSTVEAGITYEISKLMTLDMKYKATWVDYENVNNMATIGYFQYDTTTHGPIIGLTFNF